MNNLYSHIKLCARAIKLNIMQMRHVALGGEKRIYLSLWFRLTDGALMYSYIKRCDDNMMNYLCLLNVLHVVIVRGVCLTSLN